MCDGWSWVGPCCWRLTTRLLSLTADDSVLAEAMVARGLRPRAHRWGDPVRRGDVVVIRSTWDYVERPAAFAAWLDHLDAEQAIVHNPTPLLRWNAHKGYLVDLARRGLPVVPTALDRSW